jgi:Holliday junction resolvasome RuvABC endonuclease subunit
MAGLRQKVLDRRPSRVLGIDSSSQSFAYGIIDKGRLVEYGQIYYEGRTVFERLRDARRKLEELAQTLQFDYICSEQTIKVNSVKTMTILAYFEGIALAEMSSNREVKIVQLAPLKWQRLIGNKPLTTAEKAAVKKANPTMNASQLKAAYRKERKQRTAKWVLDTFGEDIPSDDVTDAISVAACAWLEVNPGGKFGKA